MDANFTSERLLSVPSGLPKFIFLIQFSVCSNPVLFDEFSGFCNLQEFCDGYPFLGCTDGEVNPQVSISRVRLVCNILINGDGSETPSLRQRLDIAIDIASALEYLHFGTGSTIVHGDLKPANVLLDEEMVAHVGDFGLAKIISNVLSTNESSTIGIRGTIGYIPPEYGISGVVSTQGDVYSYGIMLLEMFTGRRPTDEGFEDSWSLSEFVRNALPSQVMEVLDPIIVPEHNRRINVKYMDCVTLIFEIALACSVELPRDRMTMPVVVNQLKKASQLLAQS